jgi:hypothetical protein
MTQTIATHTPGPWKWNGYSLRPENPNPEAHTVHTILEVDTFAYGFVDSDLAATTAECAANRALIEAAPVMLDTLHMALFLIESGAPDRAAQAIREAIDARETKVGAGETAIRQAEAVDTAQPASMPHSLYNDPEGE